MISYFLAGKAGKGTVVPFLDTRLIRVTSSRAARVTAKGPAKDACLFLVTTAYCPLTPFPLHRLGLELRKTAIVLKIYGGLRLIRRKNRTTEGKVAASPKEYRLKGRLIRTGARKSSNSPKSIQWMKENEAK